MGIKEFLRLNLNLSYLTLILLISSVNIIKLEESYYFFSDDFLNFIIAKDMGLRLSYLGRDLFGQFVPLYRMVQLLYIDFFGLQFWPHKLFIIIFWSSSIVLIGAIASRFRVSLLIAAPAIALVTFSPLYIEAFQWWSAALSVLTCTTVSVGAVYILSTPTVMTAARIFLATACFLIGLLVYPKALFVIIILFSIRMFMHMKAGSNLARAGWRAIGDLWPIIATSILYLAIIRTGGYSSGVKPPDALSLLRFIWLGWNRGFLAGALGLDQAFPGVAILINAIFFIIIAIPIARDWRFIILWIGFILYFVVSLGVVGLNRIVPFGVESALSGRYYNDVYALFICLLLMSYGRLFSSEIAVAALWGWKRSICASGVSVTTLCFVGYLMTVGARMPSLWYVPPARVATFVTNVRSALATAGPDVRIKESIVPADIMPEWMFPLNQYSYFVRLFGIPVQVVPKGEANRIFRPDGSLAIFNRPTGETEPKYLPAAEDDTICKGFIDKIVRDATGAAVSGWAVSLTPSDQELLIILVNERLDTIGYGRTGISRPDVREKFPAYPAYSGWAGYTKLDDGPIKAFAYIDERFCQLSGHD